MMPVSRSKVICSAMALLNRHRHRLSTRGHAARFAPMTWMSGDFTMSDKMKAVRLHAFGGPEMLVYEDAPRPGVKPGEVLVRVQAAGLNPPDWYLRDGY